MFLPEWSLLYRHTLIQSCSSTTWLKQCILVPLPSAHDHIDQPQSNATVKTVKNTRHDSNPSDSDGAACTVHTFLCRAAQHGRNWRPRLLTWATAVCRAIGGWCLVLHALPTQTVPTAARDPMEYEDVGNREHGSLQTTTNLEDQEHQVTAWNPVRRKCSR